MYGDNRRSFVPVKVDQELDVKIEAVGAKGDGIAKEQGFVLFIPGVKQGDEVRVKVTKVLRNVGFAEVIGEASGPVGGEEAPQQEEAQDSESFGDEASEAPAEESQAEDSEDFGDEAASEEAQAEEPMEASEETQEEASMEDSAEEKQEA